VNTRVNPIGWGLGLFFLIGGIVFWIAIPDIYIGQIWVFVAVLLIVIFGLVGRSAKRAEQLKKEGVRGMATILSMEQTGMYVNEQPQVKFRLRVEASGMTPYEVEKKAVVPLIALGTLGAGKPLTVYIDRAERERMTIDWSGGFGDGEGAPVTISQSGGPAVSVGSDPNAVEAVTDALKKHGIEPAGTIDLRQNPAARQAVLDALKSQGVDAAHATAAADPTVPVAPASDDEPPLERLTKLMQLKGAQLITDKEFEEHKARILKQI
jgi:hypothetical protein